MNPEMDNLEQAEAVLAEQGDDRGLIESLILDYTPEFLQSDAAPGFPRARDFVETPASEWAKPDWGR